MERNEHFSTLLHSGRLFHQYIVDSYVRCENQRLKWVRHNQKQIRADLYQGVQDALADDAPNMAGVGQRVILPSSFTGGPRDMQQRCQDAYAVCARFGKPDLFMTMTCNPNWPEIKENCDRRGISVQDDPTLVCRVFKLYL